MDPLAEQIDRDLRYIDVMLAEQNFLDHQHTDTDMDGNKNEGAERHRAFITARDAMAFSAAYYSGRLVTVRNPYEVWGGYAAAVVVASAAACL
jgi:hypothetical protein